MCRTSTQSNKLSNNNNSNNNKMDMNYGNKNRKTTPETHTPRGERAEMLAITHINTTKMIIIKTNVSNYLCIVYLIFFTKSQKQRELCTCSWHFYWRKTIEEKSGKKYSWHSCCLLLCYFLYTYSLNTQFLLCVCVFCCLCWDITNPYRA